MFENWDGLEIILRATGSFVVLFIMIRFIGRKQLGQLTFFNYITGIALGTIAASVVTDIETNYVDGITSLVWWSFLTIGTAYIALKFPRGRVVLDGQPVIIIK